MIYFCHTLSSYISDHILLGGYSYQKSSICPDAELHNVNFFTQIISVQLNLPQEKARELQEVFDI